MEKGKILITGVAGLLGSRLADWVIENTNYEVIITFNPSYLLRIPENKKYAWEDLKKIKQKILDMDLHI